MVHISTFLRATIGKKAAKIDLSKVNKITIDAAELFGEKVTGSVGQRGKYLRPGTLKAKSVPTQQYIDNIYNIDMAKMELVNKEGGFYNRQAVADALAGFTHGTKVEPVVTKSEKTIDVINRMHDFDLVEGLKTAEVTGELTPAMKQKRLDILEAFDDGSMYSRSWLETSKKIFNKGGDVLPPAKILKNFDYTLVKSLKECEKRPRKFHIDLSKVFK